MEGREMAADTLRDDIAKLAGVNRVCVLVYGSRVMVRCVLDDDSGAAAVRELIEQFTAEYGEVDYRQGAVNWQEIVRLWDASAALRQVLQGVDGVSELNIKNDYLNGFVGFSCRVDSGTLERVPALISAVRRQHSDVWFFGEPA